MPCILLILAHPDDESFYAAGTIGKHIQAGIRVAVLCATRGERGSTADLCSIEELPRVREAELRAAALRLGIAAHDVHFLDYEDQKVALAAPGQIRREIAQVIRRLQPEVVITFNPNEPRQHVDHVAIARFAMGAVTEAPVPAVLWIAGFQNRPDIDYLIDIRPHRSTKEAALRAHKTQWPGLGRFFFNGDKPAETFRFEAFHVGVGPRPPNRPAASLL